MAAFSTSPGVFQGLHGFFTPPGSIPTPPIRPKTDTPLMGDAICTVEGIIRGADLPFAALHGFQPAELTGSPLAGLIAPHCRSELSLHLQIACSRGRHAFPSVHRSRDGASSPSRSRSRLDADTRPLRRPERRMNHPSPSRAPREREQPRLADPETDARPVPQPLADRHTVPADRRPRTRTTGRRRGAGARSPPASSRCPGGSQGAQAAGIGTELEILLVRVALARLPELPPELFMSVNISPETLVSTAFSACLAEHDVLRVVFELTEHTPFPEARSLARQMANVRERGGRIALDDVGSGYTSIRHVLALAPEFIKLDQTLVELAEHEVESPRDDAGARAVRGRDRLAGHRRGGGDRAAARDASRARRGPRPGVPVGATGTARGGCTHAAPSRDPGPGSYAKFSVATSWSLRPASTARTEHPTCKTLSISGAPRGLAKKNPWPCSHSIDRR